MEVPFGPKDLGFEGRTRMGQTLRLTLIDDGGGGNLGQRPRAPRAPGGVGRAGWESDTPRLRGAPLCSLLRLLPKLTPPLVLGLFQQLGVEPTGQETLFKP